VDGRIVDGVAVQEWGDPAAPGILLWPGLGSTGDYYAGVADRFPGRAVAADHPGFRRSPAPETYTYEGLVDTAAAVLGA
jgi:pimeloyl-ACP methyl ester carboxylesterase